MWCRDTSYQNNMKRVMNEFQMGWNEEMWGNIPSIHSLNHSSPFVSSQTSAVHLHKWFGNSFHYMIVSKGEQIEHRDLSPSSSSSHLKEPFDGESATTFSFLLKSGGEGCCNLLWPWESQVRIGSSLSSSQAIIAIIGRDIFPLTSFPFIKFTRALI